MEVQPIYYYKNLEQLRVKKHMIKKEYVKEMHNNDNFIVKKIFVLLHTQLLTSYFSQALKYEMNLILHTHRNEVVLKSNREDIPFYQRRFNWSRPYKYFPPLSRGSMEWVA